MKEAQQSGISVSENTQQFLIKTDISAPVVLRDKAGRIHWAIRGATPEENEQLAIRNMQGLFLEKFPEFNDLFPRNSEGKVAEEKSREAGEFVLRSVLGPKSFELTFTAAATDTRRVPAFEGFWAVAISKTFGQWGVDMGVVFDNYLRQTVNLAREIEREAAVFVATFGDINSPLLDEHGHWYAILDIDEIQSKYPGGLAGLKRKIGIRQERNDNRTVQDIEEEVNKFLEANDNNISKKLLMKNGQAGLWDAIYTKYPGGIAGIRARFGLTVKRKPRDYWTPQNIEAEIEAFIKLHGNLSYDLLTRNDRHDLRTAISKYPGGMSALKRRYILETQSTIITVDQANEQLTRLMEATNE